MDHFKTYTCSYHFDGSEWGVEIQARSHEEAEARLAALSLGRVDGELVASFPAITKATWFPNLVVRIIAFFKG